MHYTFTFPAECESTESSQYLDFHDSLCHEPGLCCRRMFDTAVVVGLYHKSDNTIDINPDETKVFSADDQVVALSTSGALLPVCLHCCCCTTPTLVGILYTVGWQAEGPLFTCSL